MGSPARRARVARGGRRRPVRTGRAVLNSKRAGTRFIPGVPGRPRAIPFERIQLVAQECCRRNKNDTLRSYRRSSGRCDPKLRRAAADWEVLWVLRLHAFDGSSLGWSPSSVRCSRQRWCSSRRRVHTHPRRTSPVATRRRPTSTSAASSPSRTSPFPTSPSRCRAAASRPRRSPMPRAAGACTCPRRRPTRSTVDEDTLPDGVIVEGENSAGGGVRTHRLEDHQPVPRRGRARDAVRSSTS